MSHLKQRDTRREAWRRFYLENYAGAISAVGDKKQEIDAYIIGLWKTIGSKGRELYINAVNKTSQDAKLSERPTKPTESSHCQESAEELNKISVKVQVNDRESESASYHHSRIALHGDTRSQGTIVEATEKNQGSLDSRDGSDDCPWPRQLTSRLCECVMLTRRKIRLSVGEIVSLSVSSGSNLDGGKQPSSTVVRLSKDGRDFARLNCPFASALGAAMQTKLVKATCSIVQAPVGSGMFTVFYGEVFILIEKTAFADPDKSGSQDNGDKGFRALRMTIIRMLHELNLIPEQGSKEVQCSQSIGDISSCGGGEDKNEAYFSSLNRIEIADAKDFRQPQALTSSLREYQKAGVRWMANREIFGSSIEPSEENGSRCYYPWKRCHFETGEDFFVNAVTGELGLKYLSSTNTGPRGGILADEMGLGKTIQCIACVMQDLENTSSGSRYWLSNKKYDGAETEDSVAATTDTRKINEESMVTRLTKKRKRDTSLGVARETSGLSTLKARNTYMLGGTLIVCPTSLVTQWMDELNFHVKPNSLRIIAHYGNMRGDETSICATFTDVVVTSYGVLASEYIPSSDCSSPSTALGPLFRLCWRRVILDEAHTIKSRNTRWAKAAYRLEAERRWCVTGTVIHNHINDVFSLIHFLRLEPWSTWSVWAKSIADPLDSKNETIRESAMSLVRDILSSVILRRKKSTKDSDGNAIVQMTKKSVQIVPIIPSLEEKNFYLALHARTKIKFNSLVAQGSVLKNYASVLEMLLRLRQACDHPYLVVKAANSENGQRFEHYRGFSNLRNFDFLISQERPAAESEKGPRSKECPICLDITDAPVCLPECGHVLCRFCLTESLQTSKTCPLCKTATEWKDADCVESGIDPKNWTSSAKIDELVKDLTARQALRNTLGKEVGKSVVFSQFASMLDITELALRRANFSFLRIDGSVPQPKRSVILQQFSSERELSNDACNVLLLSTRTGGVGLNLTSASFAVILDIHWNPQVDAQAQDRIHRHGQTRDVQIKRYVIKDSIEEKLLEVQARKEKLAEGALEDANEADEKKARLAELQLLFSG